MGLKLIKIMDTSFRDGFQSVFGARVKTEDFLPAIVEAVDAGIDHFEFGGGARFQSLFFYCQESAFDMMDSVRNAVGKDIKLQTLARGINVVGLSQQPRDIIELHAKLFKKHGTTVIRNFDALNDMRNLDYSGQCIVDNGMEHQITITLMGLPPGIKDKTVHTSEFYMEKLDEILDMGISYNSLVFKDASGTCPPSTVYDTIKKARKKLGGKAVLWFHTHDTAGAGLNCLSAAIQAGVDGVDVAQFPVSGGTGQPDILSLWHALRHTEYTINIDYEKILKSETVFENQMRRYMMPPEAKRTSPNIVLSPMPGGALTANTMMMRDSNTLHLYPRVIEEMANVVAKGGYGTSVTPVSQFYFQQAFVNVTQGQWKRITEGFGNMVLGYFGKTPRKPDSEIVEIASKQLQKPIFKDNPLDILEPGIPNAKMIIEENNLEVTDENIFIVATCKNKGLDYLKGNAPLSIYYNKEDNSQSCDIKQKIENGSLIIEIKGKDFNVDFKSPKDFEINKKEKNVQKNCSESKKNNIVGKEVIAPINGVVKKVLCKKGDNVSESDVVIVIEFLNMETEIHSFYSGIMEKMCFHKGDFVRAGEILFVVK